jgi:hypothetical protein
MLAEDEEERRREVVLCQAEWCFWRWVGIWCVLMPLLEGSPGVRLLKKIGLHVGPCVS